MTAWRIEQAYAGRHGYALTPINLGRSGFGSSAGEAGAGRPAAPGQPLPARKDLHRLARRVARSLPDSVVCVACDQQQAREAFGGVPPAGFGAEQAKDPGVELRFEPPPALPGQVDELLRGRCLDLEPSVHMDPAGQKAVAV